MNKFFQICIFCIVFLAIGIAFTNISNLQNQNTNLNNQLQQQEQTYSGKIDELTVYQEKLVERISLLEENYQKLQTAYDELKAAYDQYVADSTIEREQLQTTVTSLNATITELEQNSDVKEETIAELRAEVLTLETSLENQTTTANELQATVTQQEVTIAELNTTIDALTEELNSDLSGGIYKEIFNGTVTEITAEDLGDITQIRPYAFYNQSRLASVEIPDTVITISDSAFERCLNLKTVTLGSAVSQIGTKAFSSCRLQTLTLKQKTFSSVSSDAFNLGTTTIVINYPGTVSEWCGSSLPNFGNNAKVDLKINGESVTSINSTNLSGVTSIPSAKFKGYYKLTSITLPSTVTSIGSEAFYNCNALTSMSIPTNVKTISGSTFYNCTSLASVVIPSSITSIGESAFFGCSSLGSLNLPSSVKTVGATAFAGCSSLTSLYIPTSVTTLTSGVLKNCTALINLTLPFCGLNGTATTYSSDTLFSTLFSGTSSNDLTYKVNNYYSTGSTYIPVSLVNITISGGNIFQGAFAYLKKVKSIDVSGCTVVNSDHLCYFDSALEQISLPDTMTEIGERAFSSSDLKSINLPSSLKTICQQALRLTNIEELIIPTGVTTIGPDAFMSCRNLRKVVIPATVTSIGGYCFDDAENLNIYFYSLENIKTVNPYTSGTEGLKYSLSPWGENITIYTASTSRPSTIPSEFFFLGASKNATVKYGQTYDQFLEAISA